MPPGTKRPRGRPPLPEDNATRERLLEAARKLRDDLRQALQAERRGGARLPRGEFERRLELLRTERVAYDDASLKDALEWKLPIKKLPPLLDLDGELAALE